MAAVGPSGSSAGGMLTMVAGKAGAEGQGGAVRLASAPGSAGGSAMFFAGAGSDGAGGDISLAAGSTLAPKSEAGALRMSAGTSTTETGSGGSVRLSSGSGAQSGSIQVQPGFGGTRQGYAGTKKTKTTKVINKLNLDKKKIKLNGDNFITGKVQSYVSEGVGKKYVDEYLIFVDKTIVIFDIFLSLFFWLEKPAL